MGKCSFEGLCSCWNWSSNRGWANNFVEKKNLDKYRGSLVVNDLLFYKKDEFIAPT